MPVRERLIASPPGRKKAPSLSESLDQLEREAYPVPAHLEGALRSDHEFAAQARRRPIRERAEALFVQMCEIDLIGQVLVQEREVVSLDVIQKLELLNARLDLAIGDLTVDARGALDPDGWLTDTMASLAHMQRRRHAHRWALILQMVEPARDVPDPRRSLDSILDELELPADEAHRAALVQIHRRPPRGWLTPRWLRVLWQASGDPRAAHRAWMRAAIQGAVRDGERRPSGEIPSLQEAQILALVAGVRAAGASKRQVEVLHASLSGKSSCAIAERLGICGSTVRVHLGRAMKKIGALDRSAIAAALSAK